ncbi:hypothetical protein K439DRAFT_1228779, partial [Ramaria rubella]
DAKESPAVKFSQGVLDGKYEEHPVFTGMVEAMVNATERKDRGVGTQNFQYAPAFFNSYIKFYKT